MARLSALGLGATLTLVALSAVAAAAGSWKLLGISWVAFAAMAAAAILGARTRTDRAGTLVWGYGLASGAMVTSAAVFLLPGAIDHHAQFGGFGVALGLLVGFGAHTVGHRLSHLDLPMDRTVAELSAHALAAGAIIGVVYGNMPALGPLLGLAIVSHKGPAGYAAAKRLALRGRSWSTLLLPAAGVGVAAIGASAVRLPAAPAVRGLVFGFAAGVFLHVAMDFLPRCELGSEIHEALSVEGDAHALLDRLRLHAVASTALGGLAVFLAWTAVA
ncbi:ZIP family metal transporter [Halegenticoccus soli]|uniref:ZIP family metal transporter n=1 Tax=Halegenticoccus soli TaxID=1985678 RepID=UPI000C6D0E9C|nr:ZIP family metal transporter [Halegenticoccus soli]